MERSQSYLSTNTGTVVFDPNQRISAKSVLLKENLFLNVGDTFEIQVRDSFIMVWKFSNCINYKK